MTTLLSISIAVLAGLMLTRLIKPLHLPDVTAYLIAGILIGPYCIGALGIEGIGFVSSEDLTSVKLFSDVALGFIAFSIGNEFRISQLRSTGRNALIIGIVQALVTALVVDLVLVGVHCINPELISIPGAITLGAIAAATAPAATLMVVRQYKAKGKLTDLLLPIVALDDGVGLAVFSVSFGVAKAMVSGSPDIYSIAVDPLIEITASLILGAAAGWCLTQIEKMFHSNTNRLAMTIVFVFTTVALSKLSFSLGKCTLEFSPLLVCMMLGAVFSNMCPLSDEIMNRADRWSGPLLIMFFVVSGAELELDVLTKPAALLVGIVYIVSRTLGKYFGAWTSSKACGCDENIVKYLGITLFPQAGVALGMCVTASELGTEGDFIRNIVLFAVLVYELFGPVCTRWALTKAGEIQPQSEEVLNRRANKLATVTKRT